MKYILIMGILFVIYGFVKLYRQFKRDVKALRIKRVRSRFQDFEKAMTKAKVSVEKYAEEIGKIGDKK